MWNLVCFIKNIDACLIFFLLSEALYGFKMNRYLNVLCLIQVDKTNVEWWPPTFIIAYYIVYVMLIFRWFNKSQVYVLLFSVDHNYDILIIHYFAPLICFRTELSNSFKKVQYISVSTFFYFSIKSLSLNCAFLVLVYTHQDELGYYKSF